MTTIKRQPLTVRFTHGLGDCTYFAHQLPLYTRRGYDITVSCAPDKRILFEPCGVRITHDVSDEFASVAWPEPYSLGNPVDSAYARCNKAAYNFSRHPMPYIGEAHEQHL